MNNYSSTGLVAPAPSTPMAIRGWPPSPGKVRLKMLDSEVSLRQNAGSLGAVIGTLRAGDEADVVGTQKAEGRKWVAVALSDGRRGFIAGDTRTQVFKNVILKSARTNVFAKPGDPSTIIREMVQGERFMILGTVNATPSPAMLQQNSSATASAWAQIRDANGQQGYIDGKVKILQEGAGRKWGGGGGGRSSTSEMITGAIICGIGIAVTIGTYVAASNGGGGVYFVAWGAIVFGAIRCVRGLIRMFT
ncbi:MAG TPA: SH3 domain-containing protein [Phycisphaerae bacterium]|nr:SH3 domain-containing protein [Phycisphaerae bacterium]